MAQVTLHTQYRRNYKMYYENKLGKIGLINIVYVNNNETLWIPIDEGNVDYQIYLKWLAQGNTPGEYDNGL